MIFEITIIISCIIILILLKIFLGVNFKKIKNLKDRNLEDLEELSNEFPDDKEICKNILNKLGNSNTKIKIEHQYNSCLYTIFNNTITIGKFKQNYMKPQTIAHECIHSCQNKKTLWFNFIFTNTYLIYFAVIVILALLNKLSYVYIDTVMLIFASFIQYIIRYTLESEAMLKAKYIAKEYIEESEILTKDEEEKLLKEYDEINDIGISFVNYYTISMNILKIIIFTFIVLI